MIQIPADLGQRILDAARIAAAMHEQQQGGIAPDRDTTVHAGGAGRAAAVVIDHDGRSNPTDRTPAPSRLRRWWRSRVR
jgi:hypothetical protein